MTAEAVVADLAYRGVQLRDRRGKIDARPVAELTEDDISAIRANRVAILYLLESRASTPPSNDPEQRAVQVVETEEEAVAAAASASWPTIPPRPHERREYVLELACLRDQLVWRYRRPGAVDRSIIAASLDIADEWPLPLVHIRWIDREGEKPDGMTDGLWARLREQSLTRLIWFGMDACPGITAVNDEFHVKR